MFTFKIKNYSKSEADYDFTGSRVLSNSLDTNNCLFTPELLDCLITGGKIASNLIKQSKEYNRVFIDRKGIYLIAFNILNKEKKCLVYNYMYYDDLFYLTLIVYFIKRNYFIIKDDHEWGRYLVILDNKFLNYDRLDKYIDPYIKDKTKHKHDKFKTW